MAGWAIVPKRKLKAKTPHYLRLLTAHGDQIHMYGDQMHMYVTELDDNDDTSVQEYADTLELLGSCPPMSELSEYKKFKATWRPYRDEWCTLQLYGRDGQEGVRVHDIRDAKIVQNTNYCSNAYMFPASRGFAALSSSNAVYFFGWVSDSGIDYNHALQPS
ncbi:hypothetical protein E2562_039294 [Oryza meyeriana var. granulata]|uniref:DUF295 domain-containing protein n=1 Tax=Oryza meyeriana var. granulata TaxID=110450 RepID=A0A6G1E949_9ORYZ|nr:hypothetical protein E2562_039294 [Oryza meyeriana var. granulata]